MTSEGMHSSYKARSVACFIFSIAVIAWPVNELDNSQNNPKFLDLAGGTFLIVLLFANLYQIMRSVKIVELSVWQR